MKDFDTEFRKAFEKVMAEKAPNIDIPNNIEFQEIEIEEFDFEELPTAILPER